MSSICGVIYGLRIATRVQTVVELRASGPPDFLISVVELKASGLLHEFNMWCGLGPQDCHISSNCGGA